MPAEPLEDRPNEIIVESCNNEDIVLKLSDEDYDRVVAAGLELLRDNREAQISAGVKLLLEEAIRNIEVTP